MKKEKENLEQGQNQVDNSNYAVELLIKNLNKLNLNYKPSYIAEINDTVNQYYNCGIYALNYQLTKKIRAGFPVGRIITIAGDSGSGKTALALQFASIPEWDAVLYIQTSGEEAEKNFIQKFNELEKKMVKQVIDDYNQLNNILNEVLVLIVNTNKKYLIIIDSITGLNLDDNESNNAGFSGGRRAYMFKNILRNYANKIKNYNSSLILITQYYQSPQIIFGDNKIIGGGLAVIQYSDIILKLTSLKKESEIVKNSVLGLQEHAINIIIEKSRFGTQYSSVDYVFNVFSGFNCFSGMFSLCCDLGLIVKKGKMYYMPCILSDDLNEPFSFREVDDKKDIGFYKSNFEEKIKDEKILNKIINVIEELTKVLYKEEIQEQIKIRVKTLTKE